MDSGVSMNVTSAWYFEDINLLKSYSFLAESGTKPLEGVFENSMTVSTEERLWSRCNGTQSLTTFNTRVKMQSANKSAVGYIDNN